MCHEGYSRASAGAPCLDLTNACVTTPCDPEASCEDYLPPAGAGTSGRNCTCNPGWVGDGDICQGEHRVFSQTSLSYSPPRGPSIIPMPDDLALVGFGAPGEVGEVALAVGRCRNRICSALDVSTVCDDANCGSYFALVAPASGPAAAPLASFFYIDIEQLLVYGYCQNAQCSDKETVLLSTVGVSVRAAAMTFFPDGRLLVLVATQDSSGKAFLEFAACPDRTCGDYEPPLFGNLPLNFHSFELPSLALDHASGLPLMALVDSQDGGFSILYGRCLQAACRNVSLRVMVSTSTGSGASRLPTLNTADGTTSPPGPAAEQPHLILSVNFPVNVQVLVGGDGLPLVFWAAAFGRSSSIFVVHHCSNIDCTAFTTANTTVSYSITSASAVVNADGFLSISTTYSTLVDRRRGLPEMMIIECRNAACTKFVTDVLQVTGADDVGVAITSVSSSAAALQPGHQPYVLIPYQTDTSELGVAYCLGASCIDANECLMRIDDCDANAECRNEVVDPTQLSGRGDDISTDGPPGYTCRCNTGFVGNGTSCAAAACSCPAETDSFPNLGLLWDAAPCASTDVKSCEPLGRSGTLQRQCSANGQRSDVDVAGCFSGRLAALAGINVTDPISTLDEINSIISSPKLLGTADAGNVARILAQIANNPAFATRSSAPGFLRSFSFLTQSDPSIFDRSDLGRDCASSQSSCTPAPPLVTSLESFGINLAGSYAVGTGERFDSPDVSMEVRKVDCNAFSGYTFTEGQAKVALPSSALSNCSSGSSGASRIVAYTLSNDAIFTSQATSQSRQAGDFLGSRIISVQIDDRPEGAPLDQPVTLEWPNEDTAIGSGATLATECAFWDSDEGVWDTAGCVARQPDNFRTICVCTHLTNFAVLVRRNGNAGGDHELALEIITYIGLALSLPCLLFVIFTLLYFRRKLLQPRRDQVPNHILLHLCLCLAISLLVFVIGMDRTGNNDACQVTAVLLHFFLLAAFAWMLTEGYNIHLLLRDPFRARERYDPVRNFIFFAYGLPLAIVIVCLAGWADNYGTADNCWLTTSGDELIWAFIVPVAVVMLCNIVFFIRIAPVLRNSIRTRAEKMDTKGGERLTKLRLSFKAAVSIFMLIGLGWTFGLLAIEDTSVVFQYLFAIFTTLQGVCICIFHCLLDSTVRECWGREIARLRGVPYVPSEGTPSYSESGERRNPRPPPQRPSADYSNAGSSAALLGPSDASAEPRPGRENVFTAHTESTGFAASGDDGQSNNNSSTFGEGESQLQLFQARLSSDAAAAGGGLAADAEPHSQKETTIDDVAVDLGPRTESQRSQATHV